MLEDPLRDHRPYPNGHEKGKLREHCEQGSVEQITAICDEYLLKDLQTR